MSGPLFAINTSTVAASFKPCLTTATALRRLGRPIYATASHPSTSRLFSTTRPAQFSTSVSKMGVHNIKGKGEFDEKIGQVSDGKLVVLDCFATWCGPCKAIAPVVSQMSNEFENVNFYKVDVDESPDVAQELGIRAMPTFLLFKDGLKVGELIGANPNELQSLVESNK